METIKTIILLVSRTSRDERGFDCREERRWSDGAATMEERARKQRSGENALCGKLFSYIGWEGDQGEAAAGTKRDVSED